MGYQSVALLGGFTRFVTSIWFTNKGIMEFEEDIFVWVSGLRPNFLCIDSLLLPLPTTLSTYQYNIFKY